MAMAFLISSALLVPLAAASASSRISRASGSYTVVFIVPYMVPAAGGVALPLYSLRARPAPQYRA